MPVGSFGESQSPVCFEQEVVMSDGSRRWLRCVAAPMSLPDGAVVWDGLALDVTDLRQAEAALRDSESRLRLAQEAAGITTWDWDLESGRIVWSRAITGLPPLPDSAVDQPQVLDPLALARHFTTPCDRETALETVAHAMREEADLDFRCRLDQPDGSRRWLICLGRSIAGQQGRPARMIGILRDITPYLEAQEALRAAKTALELEVSGRRRTEAVLETLYATAPTGLCVVDPDLRLRHINQRFAALGTLPPHAYLGRKLGEALPAPLAAVLEPLCRRMMETGLPVQDQEAVARLPDGTGPERHWLVSLHPLRHPDGTLGAINLMLQDITESKAMEATLRLALEESRLAIAAKAKFFAAASHDLRQPVQTLFLFAHALHERLRDHPAQALVATMQQALEGMKSLIDTLLDISRLDSGAVEPKVTEFPLIALLQRLQADYEPRMAAKGLRLRLVGSQAWVRSDTLLLGRILGNLLENALKYTDRGEVLIGCRHRGGQLRIEVWDTGCGIPEDKQAAIFEEFVQLGDRPPTAAEGLGLGLSIVQRLARLLGHELGVRSRPGRGSVFSIAVPRAGSAVEAPQRPPLLIAGGTADRPLAVVIDDDTTILTALGILLDEWGWEVLTAETAPDAMGAIAGSRRRPDLIIADYTLDGPATGTDVVRDIRSYCNFPVPAIVLTGDTKPERALEVGRIGSHLLVKPVTPETLHELIRRLAAGG
ncbi:hybrid sensor histidine kinase/response regulator [Azospirillum thermophilum]